MTLSTISAADLPAQAYAHIVGPEVAAMFLAPDNWRPIGNRPYGSKPKWHTGLWTGTVLMRDANDGSPVDSTWLQWMRDEQWGNPEAHNLTEVVPDGAARILLINSLADLQALIAAHPARYESETFPDWEAAAKEWDAVYLTETGQWETRYSEPSLYGWDVECVLWLNHAFTARTAAGVFS